MTTKWWAATAGLLLLAGTAGADARLELSDLASGKLVYQGSTREQRVGEVLVRTTRYCRVDGTLVVESVSELDPVTRLVRRMRQLDHRTGREKRVEVDETRVSLSYRKKGDAKLETRVIERTTGLVVPESMLQHLVAHWDTLAAGRPVLFDMAVADVRRALAFRFVKDRTETRDGREVLVVRMEPDTWLFRRFVNPLQLFFEATPSHRLLETRGPVAVNDDGGDVQDLRTVFIPVQGAAPVPCDAAP